MDELQPAEAYAAAALFTLALVKVQRLRPAVNLRAHPCRSGAGPGWAGLRSAGAGLRRTVERSTPWVQKRRR